MAIEISELVIKSTIVERMPSEDEVEKNGERDDGYSDDGAENSDKSPGKGGHASLRDGILSECKDLIVAMFERERGR